MKKWDKSLKKMDTLLGIMLDWLKECDDANVFAENMLEFQYKTMDSLGLDREYNKEFTLFMGSCCILVRLCPDERYQGAKNAMLDFCKEYVKPDAE